MKVAGFRPGHIPYDILKKNVGEATIYEEALRLVVEKTLPEAIVKERLELVGQPQIQPEKLAPGNPLVYKAALDLYPEVTLGDFTALKTRPEEVKVEDADVQKSLDELRKLRAKETAVMRAAKKGDRIKMDFDVMLDKVVIENGSYKGQTIELGEGNFNFFGIFCGCFFEIGPEFGDAQFNGDFAATFGQLLVSDFHYLENLSL